MGAENELDPATTVVLEALGTRIRAARETAGMIQQQLAGVLDVTQAAVSRWESGERDPGVADLIRIADALGVQAASLLPAEPWVTPPAPAPEPLPPGRYGRVEIPGYRENEGWISEETRFGLQVAVVRDRTGTETAAIGIGPLCRVVWLPVPEPGPESRLALPAGSWRDHDDDEDLDDEDGSSWERGD
jgi:transcriptional regulator with XRE-family HTH domain